MHKMLSQTGHQTEGHSDSISGQTVAQSVVSQTGHQAEGPSCQPEIKETHDDSPIG